MSKRMYVKPAGTIDLREGHRVILAHGEVTGHCHEVVLSTEHLKDELPDELPAADFFAEPSGRRVLLVLRRCVLRHDEHDPITLDPAHPLQVRQGDVLLTPLGEGAWAVTRQREYAPDAIRTVAD